MALIIEDGSGVANADSFSTVAEARAYASARGVTLPVDDLEVEVLLRKAADFIEALESQLKGSRVLSSQALAWPREGVYIFDDIEPLVSSEIPALLKKAQNQLAIDAVTFDLQPTGTGRETIREKVDVIEVEYSSSGSGTIKPQFTKALSILEPFFISGGFTLRTLRI